ncbi:MAG: hypothetical protein HQL31_07445, partial [Planctomycetes bacterium]|nr:hypothetical protein [Planctomycetota bacterium]
MKNIKRSLSWPVLKVYDQEHSPRIAMPIGGIGTGTVSLGGRGNLRDWEIMNRPGKGFNPKGEDEGPAFFTLYAKPEGEEPVVKLLEGPIPPEEYSGAQGCSSGWHGLPRFSGSTFASAYPFAQVRLEDPRMPLDVTLRAFNPLVPPDADKSGIPVAYVSVVLKNRCERRVDASVCASIPNFIGAVVTDRSHKGQWDEVIPWGMQENANEYREADGL